MAKQNKFTKSVMERLAETDLAGEGRAPQKTAATSTANQTAVKKATPRSVKVESPTFPNLSEFITKKDARSAKNKTFYLDTQVIDAIKAVAIQQKITDSKLANDILRKVLGLDE